MTDAVGGLSRRGLIVGAATATLATPALSQNRRVWRMATAWPKDLPGPGVSARRIAERVGELSDGRLAIELFAAGEIAPAFGVFDAVASGAVELGHAASVFWSGKVRAAPLFTAAPFGLAPWEHLSWIEAGEGQAAWDALYASFGVKGALAGNTGPSLGGWFRREIHSAADLKGVKMRISGLGAEMMQALGVAPTATPPGEIVTALETGVIDAAEFAGPAADRALGLPRAAHVGYAPGFHEPNGASELLIGRALWEATAVDLRAILAAACREEHARGLAEAERANAAALAALGSEDEARVAPWPDDVLRAARPAAEAAIAALAEDGLDAARAVESWRAARRWALLNARTSYAPFLNARDV